MTNPQIVDRERWLSGMPPATRRPWYKRLLRSPLLWLSLVLLPFYAFCLYDLYMMLNPTKTYPDGTQALGLNNESLKWSAAWAGLTAAVWCLLFIWVDRYRPQKLLIWILAFGWGACASTWMAIYINTWAGEMMNTTQANSDMGARSAVFIAPFSEEVTKGTVLFLLVILYRTRIVSRLGMVSLAGLAAIGFAFIENIIYYARAYVYAHATEGFPNPRGAALELVEMRGLWTSFGHPLFTIMMAFGLAVALGARSRIVRVMAPLAGFMLAAGGHMLFNGIASVMDQEAAKRPWYFAVALVALLLIYMILGVFFHGYLVRRRLGDYHAHGWLHDRDMIVFSSLVRRFKLNLSAFLRGPRTFWRTKKFMNRMTEMAYIREGITRGTIAEGGVSRAHELLHDLEELRATALTDSAGQPVIPPTWKPAIQRAWRKVTGGGRRQPNLPPPQAPGPAGLGGQWPAP